MIKPLKYALISLGVVAALSVALIFALKAPSSDKTDDNSGTEGQINQKMIFSQNAKDVDFITFSSEYGDYKLIVNPDEGSYIEGMDVPASESEIDSLLTYATKISSLKRVDEKPSDLSIYGLDNPAAVIEVHMKNGEKYKFSIGNETPFKDGYYMLEGSTGIVHVIGYSAERLMKVQISDYVETILSESISEDDYYKINLMRITKPTQKEKVIELTLIDEDQRSDDDLYYQDYKITKPENALSVNGDYVSLYMHPSLAQIVADSVYKVHPTKQDLKDTGLDNPYYGLYFEVEKKGYDFIFSEPDKNGDMYAMRKDIDVIYKINKKYLKILDTTLGDVQSKLIFIDYIDKMDTVEITDSTGTYVFKIEGYADEEKNEPLKVTLNGEEVNVGYFKKLYMNAMNLSIDGFMDDGEQPGNTNLTIIYTYREGGKSVRIDYKYLDNRRTAITYNNETKYYTLNKKIEEFTTNLKRLLNGEEVIYN